MKTSEKFQILHEIADTLENCGGSYKDNVYDYADWYEYRFDREKYDDYASSDENLKYHDEICDKFNKYIIREQYRQSIINTLLAEIAKLI